MTANIQVKSIDLPQQLKAIRIHTVIFKTSLCRSAIYAKAKAGEFPTPIKLGGGRSSAWLEHEIDEWLQLQVQASRGNGGLL
jgi:prophage regulatory protein